MSVRAHQVAGSALSFCSRSPCCEARRNVPVLSTFAMSDYDNIVAVEADTLDRLEGVMHAQRYTKERSFVREDSLFFTGPRVSLAQWAIRQP